MKYFSFKTLGVLPILALSMAPASFATAETLEVAQMVQTYCTTTAGYGSIGVTVYDSPNGDVISRIQDGESVAFNTGDRSGDWSEVTAPDGTTGWVETQYLVCEDDAAYYEESPSGADYEEAYYEEAYYEEPSEEAYYDDSVYYEEAPDDAYYSEEYSEEEYSEEY
jgi:hypothetical protein